MPLDLTRLRLPILLLDKTEVECFKSLLSVALLHLFAYESASCNGDSISRKQLAHMRGLTQLPALLPLDLCT